LTEQVKILFSSWPAYGHLLPMLPLARAAARAGADVLVSTGADLTELVERRGFAAHTAGPTLEQSYAAAAASMAELGGPTQFGDIAPEQAMALSAEFFFGAAAVLRARDLLPMLADRRPDLIVHDNLELGAPAAAEVLGIPHITHSYGPIVPGTDRFSVVLGRTLSAADLPDPIESIFQAPYVDICPPSLQPSGSSAPWTRRVALRPEPGEIHPGDELPTGFADLPHPRTIYLTMGTVTNQRPEVFRAVLAGCADHRVNVVTTLGPGVDPAILGPQPANVLVASYLPQALVLEHCTAVVSQVGAGTMLGALCFGLPQLALPQGTDQPHNAAALVASGAGIALAPEEITPEAIAASLGRVLTEPGIRSRAAAISAEIAEMPGADAVLEELVASS
jgi:UDP:flavonoid glycosyltransferase YjiC (YdhE family)